jgi:hypothetical protein
MPGGTGRATISLGQIARKEVVMANVVIQRCPTCPNIRSHAQQISLALSQDLNVKAGIVDGAKGEFSVLVDGVPVLQRNGDSLPTWLEVEGAVANAVSAPMKA